MTDHVAAYAAPLHPILCQHHTRCSHRASQRVYTKDGQLVGFYCDGHAMSRVHQMRQADDRRARVNG